jgi:hypothetical protein
MTDQVQIFLVLTILWKVGISHSRNVFPSSSQPSPKRTDKIHREQNMLSSRYHSNSAGTRSKRKEKLYRLCDERIQRLIDDCGNIDLVEYLNGEAVNIVFVN